MNKKPGPSDFVKLLGNTPDDVARSLRLLGVNGKRRNEYKCPVAVAINEHANGWGGIRVTSYGSLTYKDCQIMDPQTTDAVRQFVKNFDSGMYPELDSDKE
jgi:hypothetical protein